MRKILITLILLLTLITPVFAKTIHISQLDNSFKITNQMSTGQYSQVNCSVTSMYMIFQLMDIDKGTPSDIRKEVRNQSGNVYSNEVDDYLRENEIEYGDEYIYTKQDFIRLLKDDKVLLLCLDLSKIGYRTSDNKINDRLVGKSASNSVTGHFVAVTGCYIDTDTKVEYLEVLDPLNYEIRYYKLDEVYKSVTSWYKWVWSFDVVEGVA